VNSEVLITIFDQLIEATITGDTKIIRLLQYLTLFPNAKCKDYKEILKYVFLSSDPNNQSDVGNYMV